MYFLVTHIVTMCIHMHSYTCMYSQTASHEYVLLQTVTQIRLFCLMASKQSLSSSFATVWLLCSFFVYFFFFWFQMMQNASLRSKPCKTTKITTLTIADTAIEQLIRSVASSSFSYSLKHSVWQSWHLLWYAHACHSPSINKTQFRFKQKLSRYEYSIC